jgi:hypothetical protein
MCSQFKDGDETEHFLESSFFMYQIPRSAVLKIHLEKLSKNLGSSEKVN